jgi:hypothetical protein
MAAGQVILGMLPSSDFEIPANSFCHASDVRPRFQPQKYFIRRSKPFVIPFALVLFTFLQSIHIWK